MFSLIFPALLAVFANRIELIGTSRLPGARGTVKVLAAVAAHAGEGEAIDSSRSSSVSSNGGSIRIFVRLDGMKPAALFGGDFNTYVLWLVPPGGRPQNAGEIPLNGDNAKFQTSTHLTTFGVFVTAEPHFAVSAPSRFVVLRITHTDDLPDFDCQTRGIAYNYERNSLAHAKEAAGPVRSGLKQAFTAVRLAERAGAIQFAPEELREAQKSLQLTLELSRHGGSFEDVDQHARQTVQLAATAQQSAESRAGTNYR